MACLRTRKKSKAHAAQVVALKEEWAIEEIITRRISRQNVDVSWQYFIKWQNLPAESNTWEPGVHLNNLDAIVAFIEKYKVTFPSHPAATQHLSLNVITGLQGENVLKRDDPSQIQLPEPNSLLDIDNHKINYPYRQISDKVYLCAKSDASEYEQMNYSLRIYSSRSRIENNDIDDHPSEDLNSFRLLAENQPPLPDSTSFPLPLPKLDEPSSPDNQSNRGPSTKFTHKQYSLRDVKKSQFRALRRVLTQDDLRQDSNTNPLQTKDLNRIPNRKKSYRNPFIVK